LPTVGGSLLLAGSWLLTRVRAGRTSATIGCMSHRIEQEIMIDAPVDVVWRTITEPDQIRLWFADRVELDVRPGGAGTLVFDTPDGELATTLTVEAADEPHRLAYRW